MRADWVFCWNCASGLCKTESSSNSRTQTNSWQTCCGLHIWIPSSTCHLKRLRHCVSPLRLKEQAVSISWVSNVVRMKATFRNPHGERIMKQRTLLLTAVLTVLVSLSFGVVSSAKRQQRTEKEFALVFKVTGPEFFKKTQEPAPSCSAASCRRYR